MAKKAVRKGAGKKAQKRSTPRRAAPARRADFGAPVTAYFASLEPAQRRVAQAAHRVLLCAAPMLKHEVKWGIAQYLFPGGAMTDAEGFALYATTRSVNLAVGKGGELAKKHPLLEGTGKSMRHVKLRTVADARSPAVADIIADAVALANR